MVDLYPNNVEDEINRRRGLHTKAHTHNHKAIGQREKHNEAVIAWSRKDPEGIGPVIYTPPSPIRGMMKANGRMATQMGRSDKRTVMV